MKACLILLLMALSGCTSHVRPIERPIKPMVSNEELYKVVLSMLLEDNEHKYSVHKEITDKGYKITKIVRR